MRHLSLLYTLFILGCQTTPPTNLDPDRILRMAGDEAGQIASPRDKLTRQLNVADRQADTKKLAEARQTLALARKTLESADKTAFTDQQRLAGWVSLSELSRKTEDKSFANAALDQALKSLEEVTPHQARSQYVLGVERELKELRGEREAARLLVKAGDWAMELVERSTRRAAYLDFSFELFCCNDYEGARNMLRRDPDAAWRSDSLVDIADRARYATGKTVLGFIAAVQSEAPAPSDTGQTVNEPFSKPLDFQSNYRRR